MSERRTITLEERRGISFSVDPETAEAIRVWEDVHAVNREVAEQAMLEVMEAIDRDLLGRAE